MQHNERREREKYSFEGYAVKYSLENVNTHEWE
jgi:hypothetical protein